MQKTVLLTEEELEATIKACVTWCLRRYGLIQPPQLLPEVADDTDLKEAMKITGLAAPTIYGLTSKNKMPHKKEGKFLRFSRAELLEFVNNRRHTPTH